ncbi:uncharacterized protein RCH25_053302 [Pelodytes ibericus]
MYAVSSKGDLYMGPMSLDLNQDWFSVAKRVGKAGWDKIKCLFFDGKGEMYAVTKEGAFYKGPAPSNENVPWLYGQATKIGSAGWNKFAALFFDLQDLLYAVINDKLVTGSLPTDPDTDWLDNTTTIGDKDWSRFTHFIDISPEGDLWFVDSKNGTIYKGPIPTKDDSQYLEKAENLGVGYNKYPCMSFTTDKTIKSIVSFEFLPDSGKASAKSTELVHSQIYSNKSSTPLKHTFKFSKTLTQSSLFSHDHGFSMALGANLHFEAGVPHKADGEGSIFIDIYKTQVWHFSEKNKTQIEFSSTDAVEVPAGQGIRMMASVSKVEMEIPYRATILTLFGYETTIEGLWKGVTHNDMKVSQEDYNE